MNIKFLLVLLVSTISATLGFAQITVTTNTGAKTETCEAQYYGYNPTKKSFDSLYLKVNVAQPKMWTSLHLRFVGKEGLFMGNNFATYKTGNGTASRNGSAIALTPGFEGLTGLTMTGLNSPRLAMRLVGEEFTAFPPEGKDSTHTYLKFDLETEEIVGVTWFPPKGNVFTLSVSDTRGYAAALDKAHAEARVVHEAAQAKWETAVATAQAAENDAELDRLYENMPEMPDVDVPRDVRQKVTLTVGQKIVVTIYGRKFEVTRIW